MVKRVRQTDEFPDGTSVEWPRPVYERCWTDPSGIGWQMRGDALDPKAARRLIRRSDVAVLHAYGLNVALVHGEDRTALLRRVEQFLRGRAPEFSVFELGDFRDPDRRVMLVVQESC